MFDVTTLSKRYLTGCVLGVSVCLSLGCNTSSTPSDVKTEEATTKSTAPADQVAKVVPENILAGIWLGEASLNEAKFQQKIGQLAPDRQQLMLAKAESFMSMVMAMEFRIDGNVETGVEIVSTDGLLLRDSSAGKWKIIAADNNELIVEIQESLSDGSIAQDQKVYLFSEEGDQFAMAVPVGDELIGCDARLVFQRKTLPAANLAEGPSEMQAK